MSTFVTHNTGISKNSHNDEKYDELLAEKYMISGKIRSGGFGDVYRGYRCCDNLSIAVKVIKKEKIKKWTKVRECI